MTCLARGYFAHLNWAPANFHLTKVLYIFHCLLRSFIYFRFLFQIKLLLNKFIEFAENFGNGTVDKIINYINERGVRIITCSILVTK